jgi:hypothetical protein
MACEEEDMCMTHVEWCLTSHTPATSLRRKIYAWHVRRRIHACHMCMSYVEW